MMMLRPPEGALQTDDAAAPSHWRQAPFNLQAEQALLGALLLNNDVLARVDDIVVPADFYEPLHAEIFSTASAMIGAGRVASPVTIRPYFETAEPINETMTVPQYLGRLAISATTIINARDYARTIHDLATRRRLIHIGEDIVNAAYDNTVEQPPDVLIEEAEKELTALAERGHKTAHVSTFAQAIERAVASADEAYKRDGGLHGLATGLIDLDRHMGGMPKGKLIILAGRPAMGKSALASTIAYNVAKSGHPVAFFSLEMSDEEIAMRLVAAETGVSASKYNRGLADQRQMESLITTANRIKGLPIHFDTRGGVSAAQVAARARRMLRQNRIELLVVDYLQLLRASTRRGGENRVQEITEITSGLKALAMELQIPVIALSQLSRAVEARENKRPQLSDLRESGSIEQDADIVAFVYRDEYYIERRKPSEDDIAFLDWQKDMAKSKGKAEVIFGKFRDGRTGTVELAFQADVTRFGNLARAGMEGGHE